MELRKLDYVLWSAKVVAPNRGSEAPGSEDLPKEWEVQVLSCYNLYLNYKPEVPWLLRES